MFGNISHPAVKKQKSSKLPVLLCLALLSFSLFAGCGGDRPPTADAPEPPAHNGVFRSDVGTLTFNGDGESITVCFEDGFAAEAGLPGGKCEGTYTFKFQQKAYRYDKAEYFNIYIGEQEFSFRNHFQETNENIISVTSPVSVSESLKFIKTKVPS